MNMTHRKEPIAKDEEGYLIDPYQWDESVAHQLAESESLQLEEDHWR